jgi:hypothetical protein
MLEVLILSESEVKKCPKCGGEMEEGYLPNAPVGNVESPFWNRRLQTYRL